MMLLITMAIVVAWGSSMASSLGWFDLEFWWELAALVTIMLLGHWQEMKAIGQARGALAALAALLPDEAEVVDTGGVRVMPCRTSKPASWCSSGPVHAFPQTVSSSRAKRSSSRR
jgi:Cu2+-exporting ATPase